MRLDQMKEIIRHSWFNSVDHKSSIERASWEALVAPGPLPIPRPMSAVSTPEIFQTTKQTDPKQPADRQDATSPAPDTAPADHRPTAAGAKAEHMPMAERLAEIFKQAIESAIQQQEDAASARLAKQVEARISQTQQVALETLRNEITQQMSALEDQLLEQSRLRTEQMLSTTLKTALQGLSNQIDEMTGRTKELIGGIFSDLVNQLERRSTRALAENITRLEEQMLQSATSVHGNMVQKLLHEMNEKQKDLLSEAERQIGMAAEENLAKLRGGLSDALQKLAGASQQETLAV
jgi:hypothetical protein